MKNIPLYKVRPINNLKELLNSSSDLYSDRNAFLVKQTESNEYKPVSYKRFKEDVDALGTALINLGLKSKRIALIGENRYEWTVSYLAVVNGTGIIVPLDKELPINEIKNLIERSDANAIIFSGNTSKQLGNISQKISSLEFYVNMDGTEKNGSVLSFESLLKTGYDLINNGDRRFLDAVINNEIMNILLFTSGTTENSKAVMLSHKNVASNLMAMCSMLFIGEEDVFLSVLPLHHTYECTCGFLCPIYRGASVAFCEGLRHIPKNLQESKATIMLGVPLIFEAIYRRIWELASKKTGIVRIFRLAISINNLLKKFNADISKKLFAPVHRNFGGHIRLFISGAAGIDPHVAKGFRELGIGFVQGYGLTECSPIVALNRDIDFIDNSAGLPMPNLEIKIEKGFNGDIGEITVKGPSVMLGYFENTEATNKVFMDGGWFRTGDMGYIDDNNFIYITGRVKNVIVTKNGKNIYPEEIETLLNRSPYIKESLVHGIDDEASGEVVVSALIVADMEKLMEDFKGNQLSQDFIRNLIQNEIKHINKQLVIYKHVKDFSLREDEFAKTTTKKIKRYLERK